ncbi:5-methylcytosine-specific restriction endonuclease McrA [Natronorubrum daqingense]|nr:5-methylcytosine-specific restriction endonuclease McrA [Natronorubrum daqingense]
MDDLFPQERSDLCRVCNEPVVDGRWNYCSRRCRDIATAVQRMFLWDVVREQILERDDYTCQECGETQDAAVEQQSMEVDHIQRITDGGHPFEESNLQTLCEDCHEAKTATENSGRDPAPSVTLENYIDS